ncbi:MAG: hypothetical protein J6V78_04550 [Clostridia bacterium]|nr:hypothetical protein [Clostridia bacterium]
MKSVVKKFAVLFVAMALIAVACLPMVAFEVKRYYGDFDNDGKVTVTDARNILCEAIGIYDSTLGEHDFAAADINGDGVLTTADARLALRIAAQLEVKEFMPTYEFNKHEEEIVGFINDYRKTQSENALPDLRLSTELSAAADQAAMEFALQTGTALRRGNGTYYNTLLDEKDIVYNFADKVMCVSTTSYAQCYDKMLSEAQSRKAFLSQNFSEIGIGAFSRDGRTVYWCIILIG